MAEDAVPRIMCLRAGCLRNVTDDRHRTIERTTINHPQLHGRQILRFVDNDVAIGPDTVGVAMFRSRAE